MVDDNRPQLAAVLLKYRELNHFTQQFVADKIGITRSAYTYYETGKTEPSFETLDLLRKLLNIPYEELFSKEKRGSYVMLSDSISRSSFHYDDDPDYASDAPRTMGELNKDERELIANYRLANNVMRRKARNLLDPDYQELKNKKTLK